MAWAGGHGGQGGQEECGGVVTAAIYGSIGAVAACYSSCWRRLKATFLQGYRSACVYE